jgi:long-subunit acyl-CoA synthetase (AMP-forming)
VESVFLSDFFFEGFFFFFFFFHRFLFIVFCSSSFSFSVATISYTSGTTGDPKGVMLTHRNLIANLSALLDRLADAKPGPHHRHLSYLPLAHMLERIICLAVIASGARLAFNSDREKLFDDLAALKREKKKL